MRLGKSDPTGAYSYLADGVAPASPVLTDGRSTFTPGISETHGMGNGAYASVFYLADAQGNSRGLLDGGQGNTDGYNWDAFGNSVSRFGTNPTAFAWNEESGYQSDGDSGLKLLGHRYYDSRTGRFISQDPAGAGGNWYAYCDNDPMDETDPDGLVAQGINGGNASLGGPMALAADLANFDASFGLTAYTHDWTEIHNGSLAWVHEPGSDTYTMFATLPSWPEAALDSVANMLDQAARSAMSVVTQKPVHECFIRGTRVQTKDKPQEIQTIRTGDLVWSRNLQTGKTEYRRVVQTSHYLAHDTVTVQFADAKTGKIVDTLTATLEHPFYVPGHGMTALDKLGIGTLVVTRAGPSAIVKSLVRHHSASGMMVYGIVVAGDHTYFVGNAGEWVHNASFSPVHQALIDLAQDAKNRARPGDGIPADQAKQLLAWAKEYGLFHSKNKQGVPMWEAHTNKPGVGRFPHIRIGPINHIWTQIW